MQSPTTGPKNLDESVAMIGGMRSTRIRPSLKTPTTAPQASAMTNPRTTMESRVSMIFVETAPAKVMVAGMERSTFPGPRVMTYICPVPTITENVANAKAADRISPAPKGENRRPSDQNPKIVSGKVAGCTQRKSREFCGEVPIEPRIPARCSRFRRTPMNGACDFIRPGHPECSRRVRRATGPRP